MSLYHKQIPPSLNFKKPNPKINFEDSPFYVVEKLEAWDENEIRTAGVTSLGMGGTNAHVILQEYKNENKIIENKIDEPYLYKFSAKTLDSLKRQLKEYYQFLTKKEHISLKNVAYTLSVGRENFNYRKSLVALNKEELLKEILNEEQIINVQDYPNKLAFMFSGQGTQYTKMAYDLYQNYAVFRKVLDFCAEKLTSLIDLDIREILFDNKTNQELLKNTNISQPVIFSIQYALAKLLLDFGVVPNQFIGHSLGEYTMATVLGVIDIDDALEIVAKRGELMQKAPKGKMLIVKSNNTQIQEYLKKYNVSLAAVNTKDFFTLSGTAENISNLEAYLVQQKIFCRIFPSSHAFHSYLLDDVKEEFENFINTYKFKNIEKQILSTSKGGFIKSEEFIKPEYWANQLRNPVLFKDSLEELLKEDDYVLIEIGVDNTLSKLAKMIDSNVTCVHCLENNSNDNVQFMNTLAKLWLYGFNIDQSKLIKDQNWERCSMPGYSFDPQIHWVSNEGNLKHVKYGTSEMENTSISEPKLDNPEEVLKFAWNKLLGIDIKEENKTLSFFESGGHSLMATQLISIIDKKLKIVIGLSEIYENETYQEMIMLIQRKNKNHKKIIKSEKKLYYDLSCAQRLIWLDNNLFKNSSYNLHQAFSIKGKFNIEKARLAIKMLVDKNEMLRANFLTIDNGPKMFVNDVSEIEEEDYLLLKNDAVGYEELLLAETQKVLDLESDSLFKAIILQIKENEYIVCFVIHHIISDGWSIHVLVKEFINTYLNLIENEDYKVISTEYNYMDYVENEKMEIINLSQKNSNDYINNFLLDKTKIEFQPKKKLNLIVDREGFSEKIKVNQKTYEGLSLIAKSNKVTLFTVLLAQLKIALSKIYNQRAVTVITGTAGREVQDFESIIGLFVKSFMVQTIIDKDNTDEIIYQKVHDNFLKAYENYFSGIEVFKKTEASNVIFQLDNISSVSGIDKFKLDNLEIKDLHVKSNKVKTDLLVYAIEGNGLEIIFEFNSNIFDTDSAKNIITTYHKLLDMISEKFFQIN